MFNSYSIDKASLDRVANNLESMRLSMLSPGPARSERHARRSPPLGRNDADFEERRR